MKRTINGYPLIISYLGIFSILIGIINLIPLFLLFFRPQEIKYLPNFLIPGLATILIGMGITFYFKNTQKGKLIRNQDAVLVLLVWLYAILVSSFPFLMTGTYNFTQSIFETTSGYSTTGFTIVDVEKAPDIYLFFRSLLQFFGGVGLVLILTSAISDKLGMKLYSAEGHSDKLLPNLIRSARMILSIYVGYIIMGTLAYILFKMPVFDALNHSISAVATGGFSTKADSIGHYQSLGIEIVTMVLMILGGTNFFIHLLLIKRKLKNVTKHIELRFMALLFLIMIPIFVISYQHHTQATLGMSIRISVFHFISALTTTGLTIIPSVNIFPSTILFLTLILMMIGASIGSTAGGMKLYRVALALKSILWSLKESFQHKRLIRPHFVNRYGVKHQIEIETINQNYTFIAIYIMILVSGISIFTLYGHSFKDSVFEFTSILGTIGLSTGLVQYGSPLGVLWTGIIGMLIARLESIVIIVAILQVFADLNLKKTHHIEKNQNNPSSR